MANNMLLDDEEKTELNGSADETLQTARDTANNAVAEQTATPAESVPAPAPKPTYTTDEFVNHFRNGTDYTQEQLDAMSPEEWASYNKTADEYYKAHPTRQMQMDRHKARLELAEQLQKKAQFTAEHTEGDDDFKADHDLAMKEVDFLTNHPNRFVDMSDEDAAVLASGIEKKYKEAADRRGHLEVAWDNLKKGYWSLGNMFYQGSEILAPGLLDSGRSVHAEMDGEDWDNLKGSMETKHDLDIQYPQKVGEIQNIHSIGDTFDWLTENVGENAPRMVAQAGFTAAGAVAGGVPGAILFGTLGTMALNTGEAVQDQFEENRTDDITKTRGWIAVQGGVYSIFDGAFGASAWGGRLLAGALKRAGAKTLAESMARSAVVRDMERTAAMSTVKGAMKETLIHGGLEEGFQEMSQSGVGGGLIRYLQTGSFLKNKGNGERQTAKDFAWDMANEFLGGAAAGLTFGLIGGGASHVNAKRTVDTMNKIDFALEDDKAYQQLGTYEKLLVKRHLINDAYLETTNLIQPEIKASLDKCNKDIDNEIRRLSELKGDRHADERIAGQSARLYLDLFKSNYALEEIGDVIKDFNPQTGEFACNDGNTYKSTLDLDGMKRSARLATDKDGNKAIVYTNPTEGSKISVMEFLDKDGNPNGRYSFNNDESRKMPLFSLERDKDGNPTNGLVCKDLNEALQKAQQIDIFNQWREKKMESKAKVATQVFEHLFGGRGVSLRFVDKPSEGTASVATTVAAYNHKNNTVEINLDNINNIGSLYTNLVHERCHEDIVDFLLASGKFYKYKDGVRSIDWDAFDAEKERLFSRVSDRSITSVEQLKSRLAGSGAFNKKGADGQLTYDENKINQVAAELWPQVKRNGLTAEMLSSLYRKPGAKADEKGKYSDGQRTAKWGESAGYAGEEMTAERTSIIDLAKQLRNADRGIIGGILDKVRSAIGMKMALDMGLDPRAIRDDDVATEMDKIFEIGYLGEPAEAGFKRENSTEYRSPMKGQSEDEFLAKQGYAKAGPTVSGNEEVNMGTENMAADEEKPAAAPTVKHLKPQMANGEGASLANHTNIVRADGAKFTKFEKENGSYVWTNLDTNEDVDDATATEGGYDVIHTETQAAPSVEAPTETAPTEANAEEAPKPAAETPAAVETKNEPSEAPSAPEAVSAPSEAKAETPVAEAPKAETPKAEEPAKPVAAEPEKTEPAPTSDEKPTEVDKAKKPKAKKPSEPEPVKANPDETVTVPQNKAMPVKVDAKSETVTVPAKADKPTKFTPEKKKKLVKETGLSSKFYNAETQERWLRLDELPDGTTIKAGGGKFTKVGKIAGKAESTWKDANGKTHIQSTIAHIGDFNVVDASEAKAEEPKAAEKPTEAKPKKTEKKEKPKAEKPKPEPATEQKPIEKPKAEEKPAAHVSVDEKKDEANIKFEAIDREIDENLDAFYKDTVSDKQRPAIKQLAHEHGEIKDVRLSGKFNGYVGVFFKGGKFQMVSPDGKVMSQEDIDALKNGDKGGSGSVVSSAKEIMRLPEISRSSGMSLGGRVVKALVGEPTKYKSYSDDKLLSLRAIDGDYTALRVLWNRWATRKIPEWYLRKGVQEGDNLDEWMRRTWNSMVRVLGESDELEVERAAHNAALERAIAVEQQLASDEKKAEDKDEYYRKSIPILQAIRDQILFYTGRGASVNAGIGLSKYGSEGLPLGAMFSPEEIQTIRNIETSIAQRRRHLRIKGVLDAVIERDPFIVAQQEILRRFNPTISHFGNSGLSAEIEKLRSAKKSVEEARKDGTPLGRTVTADSFFYGILNGIWTQKEISDELAARKKADEEYKETEARRILAEKEREEALARRREKEDANFAMFFGEEELEKRKAAAVSESAEIPRRYKTMDEKELCKLCVPQNGRPADRFAQQEVKVRVLQDLVKEYRPKIRKTKEMSAEERVAADDENENTAVDNVVYNSVIGYKLSKSKLPRTLERDVLDYVMDTIEKEWNDSDVSPIWKGNGDSGLSIKTHALSIANMRIRQLVDEYANDRIKGAFSLDDLETRAGSKVESDAAMGVNAAFGIDDEYVGGDVLLPRDDDRAERKERGYFATAADAVGNMIDSGLLTKNQQNILTALINSWSSLISDAFMALEEAKSRRAHGNTIRALEGKLRDAQHLAADDWTVLERAAESLNMKPAVYRAKLGILLDVIERGFVRPETYEKQKSGEALSRREQRLLVGLGQGRFTEGKMRKSLSGVSSFDRQSILDDNEVDLVSYMRFNGDEAMAWCVEQAMHGATDNAIMTKVNNGAIKGMKNESGVYTSTTLLDRAYEDYGWIDKRVYRDGMLDDIVHKLIRKYRGNRELTRESSKDRTDVLALVGAWLALNDVKVDENKLARSVYSALASREFHPVTKRESERVARERRAAASKASYDLVERMLGENGNDRPAVERALEKDGMSKEEIKKTFKRWNAEKTVVDEKERKAHIAREAAALKAKTEELRNTKPNAPAKTNEDVVRSLDFQTKRDLLVNEIRKTGDESLTDGQIIAFATDGLGMTEWQANAVLRQERPSSHVMTDEELARRAADMGAKMVHDGEVAETPASSEQPTDIPVTWKVKREHGAPTKRDEEYANEVREIAKEIRSRGIEPDGTMVRDELVKKAKKRSLSDKRANELANEKLYSYAVVTGQVKKDADSHAHERMPGVPGNGSTFYKVEVRGIHGGILNDFDYYADSPRDAVRAAINFRLSVNGPEARDYEYIPHAMSEKDDILSGHDANRSTEGIDSGKALEDDGEVGHGMDSDRAGRADGAPQAGEGVESRRTSEGRRMADRDGEEDLYQEPFEEEEPDVEPIGDTDETQAWRDSHRHERIVTPEMDAAYADAVKRGDKETALRMIREAAAKAGYDKELWHGTLNQFWKFDVDKIWNLGIHLGTKRAAEHRIRDLEFIRSGNPRIIHAYAKINNPVELPYLFEVPDELARYIIASIGYSERLNKKHGDDYTEADEFRDDFYEKHGSYRLLNCLRRNEYADSLKSTVESYIPKKWVISKEDELDSLRKISKEIVKYLKSLGFDGVVNINEYEDPFSDSYIAFDSSQIKSADITYDDAGNLIPLSERFNPENNDIRYAERFDTPDQNALYPAKESQVHHDVIDENFKSRAHKRNEKLREEAEELRKKGGWEFRKVIEDGRSGKILTDVQVVALLLDQADRLKQSMDGSLDADAEEANQRWIRDEAEALRYGLSEAAAALAAAKFGVDLRTMDTVAYIRSQLKAKMEREIEKEHGVIAVPDYQTQIEKELAKKDARISEMAAEMKKLHDKIDEQKKTIAEKDKKADEKTVNRIADEAYRKGVEEGVAKGERKATEAEARRRAESIERAIKEFGFDEKYAEATIDALDELGDVFGVEKRFAGNPKTELTDRARKLFAIVLRGAGNDEAKARAAIEAKYGGTVSEMFDKFVAEENSKAVSPDGSMEGKKKARRRNVKRMADEAEAEAKPDEVDVSEVVQPETPEAPKRKIRVKNAKGRSYIEKLKNKTADAALSAKDAADEALRLQYIGEYARNYFKLLKIVKPDAEGVSLLGELAKRMSGVIPGATFDENDAKDALLMRGDFPKISREKSRATYEQLKKAAEFLTKNPTKVAEAAVMAGIEYVSDAELLQKLDHELGRQVDKMLNRYESRVNEEDNRELGEELHKYIMALHDIRSGKPTKELLAKYLDLSAGLKDYRRQRSVLERIQSRIEMYERKLANNDFEPTPKRENPDTLKELKAIRHAEMDLERLRQRFKHERDQWHMKNLPRGERAMSSIMTLLAETKAIRGTLDLSSTLRQGGQLSWAHPILFWKNLKKTLGIMKSEDAANEAYDSIWDRPNAKYYQLAGIDFTLWGDNAASRDDAFYLLNKYRGLTNEKHIKGLMNASERAFSMYLNLMRADVFDAMIASSPLRDASRFSVDQLKAIGRFINVGSQRGSFDSESEWASKLKDALPAMNVVLWSPRNVISRFQFIANTLKLFMPGFKTYGTTDMTMRKMFAKETLRYFTGVAAAIMFAKLMADLFRTKDEPPEDIELDPRSSDFLKVKFGNTRLDFLSGLQPLFVFSERFRTGKTKTLRGQEMEADRLKLAARLARSKFSPMASIIWDWASRETFEHQDISFALTDQLKSRDDLIGFTRYAGENLFCPLSISDLFEQIKYSGIGRAPITWMLATLGVGAQSFDPYTYKQLSGDYKYFRKLFLEAESNEERERLKTYHPMLNNMGKIEDSLKAVRAYEKAIREYRKTLDFVKAHNGEQSQIKNLESSVADFTDRLDQAKKVAVNAMVGFRHPDRTE